MKIIICFVKKFYNVKPIFTWKFELFVSFSIMINFLFCLYPLIQQNIQMELCHADSFWRVDDIQSMVFTFEHPKQKNLVNLVNFQSVTYHVHQTIWVLVVVTMKLHMSHAFKQQNKNHKGQEYNTYQAPINTFQSGSMIYRFLAGSHVLKNVVVGDISN